MLLELDLTYRNTHIYKVIQSEQIKSLLIINVKKIESLWQMKSYKYNHEFKEYEKFELNIILKIFMSTCI